MASDDFHLNYVGMGKFLVSEDMLKMVGGKGAVVLATAEATAPDAEPYGEGYIASFELEVGIREGKHPRACATVRNTSPHAIYVEFGGKATPRHRTLGKALGAAL